MAANKNYKQKGFITVDFMLAMIVTLGCMMLLLRVAVSLVSVQIAQYIAFAAARAQSAGDLTQEVQIANGEEKYKKLLKVEGLVAGFLKPGLTIQRSGVIGQFDQIYSPPPESDGTSEKGLPFVGARVEIKLLRLKFNIPFLGRTADDDQDFKTHVNAMIFREPSNEDCRNFFRNSRYSAILELDSARFGRASGYASQYVPMEDSGC